MVDTERCRREMSALVSGSIERCQGNTMKVSKVVGMKTREMSGFGKRGVGVDREVSGSRERCRGPKEGYRPRDFGPESVSG